jgi:hypothetical protein
MKHFSKRLLILQIVDGNEGYALRAIAEQFGIRVDWRGIGSANDLVEEVKSSRHDLVLFSCHGLNGSLCMPELVPSVAAKQSFTGSLGPDEVRRYLTFHGQPVLCLGCSTGNPALTDAFTSSGAGWYVAPQVEIEGAASTRFAVEFLYQLFARGVGPDQAFGAARRQDDDSQHFGIWKK